jgi:hypothetical protein
MVDLPATQKVKKIRVNRPDMSIGSNLIWAFPIPLSPLSMDALTSLQ